jgi:hypothetical protein
MRKSVSFLMLATQWLIATIVRGWGRSAMSSLAKIDDSGAGRPRSLRTTQIPGRLWRRSHPSHLACAERRHEKRLHDLWSPRLSKSPSPISGEMRSPVPAWDHRGKPRNVAGSNHHGLKLPVRQNQKKRTGA